MKSKKTKKRMFFMTLVFFTKFSFKKKTGQKNDLYNTTPNFKQDSITYFIYPNRFRYLVLLCRTICNIISI